MSKKVVHLSDDAHELAKGYCKESGMKMSDWVAMLIKRAVEPAPQAAAPVAAPVQSHPAIRESAPPRMAEQRPTSLSSSSMSAPQMTSSSSAMHTSSQSHQQVQAAHNPNLPKKKPMLRDLSASDAEDATPVYAQPPFWARKSS